MARADVTEAVHNVQAREDAIGHDQVVEDRIEGWYRSSLHESGWSGPTARGGLDQRSDRAMELLKRDRCMQFYLNGYRVGDPDVLPPRRECK